jgi:hypothetical protein
MHSSIAAQRETTPESIHIQQNLKGNNIYKRNNENICPPKEAAAWES